MAKTTHFILLYFAILFLSFFNNSFASEVSYIINHQHHKYNPKNEAKIGVYELKKSNISVKLTNYGATVISVLLPDKYVLGYDKAKDYVELNRSVKMEIAREKKNDTTYFGAVVGRVANRIANAEFTYKGTQYKLVPNEGENILHGGPKGFSRVIWKVEKYRPKASSPYVTFSYFSSDGEEGFPGDLKVTATYRIVQEKHLLVSMKAKPLNKPTPVNLAQHTYWNLGGHNSGNILENEVQIFASQVTPVDANFIPTGEFQNVKGTPFDFLKPHNVGSRLKAIPKGYDINYVLDRVKTHSGVIRPVAVVSEKKSGRVMELWANTPGVQFYTSNTLNAIGKGGYEYKPYAALCLETQGFPDAVNQPHFPSVMVAPGETYEHHMFFKFSTVC